MKVWHTSARVSVLAKDVANISQPGAGMGVQPINTLNSNAVADRINPARKHTYSKSDRNAAKLFSREQFPARVEYRTLHPEHNSAAAPDYVVAGSPAKRRKTGNFNEAPVDTIEVGDSDEDEIQPVAPPARQTPTPRPPSSFSSHSPHSTTSRHSGISSKAASQPTSEFANTSNFLAPKRQRPRRKGANDQDESRGVSHAEVPFLGAGSQAQEHPIEIHQDNFKSRHSARGLILQDLKQGWKGSLVPNESQHTDGRVTSSHFKPDNSKMRINESTRAEATAREYDRIAGDLARQSASGRNLRDFRPAEHASGVRGDPIEGSEDELAQMTPNTSKPRRRESPSKAVPKGDSRQQNDGAGKCYRLRYARTYNLNVNFEDLQLRQDKTNPKNFRITTFDSERNVQTLETIDLRRVNRTDFDNVNRIRLLGPVTNGNRYWFDLQFADSHEFPNFRVTYVVPECLHNMVTTR